MVNFLSQNSTNNNFQFQQTNVYSLRFSSNNLFHSCDSILMVGLYDLKGVFWTKWFYDYVILSCKWLWTVMLTTRTLDWDHKLFTIRDQIIWIIRLTVVQFINQLISLLFVVQSPNWDMESNWVECIEEILVVILWSVSKED